MAWIWLLVLMVLGSASPLVSAVPGVREDTAEIPDSAKVTFFFDQKVRMRDGALLSATLYRPAKQVEPSPCIATITPYIADSYHDRGVYFAARGLPFLVVNSRGRALSEGIFRPFENDSSDGADVVEWLASKDFCDGKVGMWGGSYAGFNQWATARANPPHLATIVPVASPFFGADVPGRSNIPINYMLQWMLYIKGRSLQEKAFGDADYWNALWLDRFENGDAFNTLGELPNHKEPLLREWAKHPYMDAYWDRLNPSTMEYRDLDVPVLTITGSYDDDQPGALSHYRALMAASPASYRDRHFLVIGPWDHFGTRTPQLEFGGVHFGEESLIDLPKLHVDWYRWTMGAGKKPHFLKQPVAYYVMGANQWRYAESLDAVTETTESFFLGSSANADRVFASGSLDPEPSGNRHTDTYIYDPRDVSLASLEASLDPLSLVEQRLLLARDGKHLVYHSSPFEHATEVSGFFRLSAWLSIDQPDTDFKVSIYEVEPGGEAILLSTDFLRARHRESPRESKLVTSIDPLLYNFERFTFVSREITAGSRLRLVIAPVDSIHLQKNYNSPKPVAEQTLSDARPVTVRLFHDEEHPSVLTVPIACCQQ